MPYEPLSREAVVAIALREWRLFGQGVDDDPPGTRPPPAPDEKPERWPGMWQRVGEYWWLGVDPNDREAAWTGKHDENGIEFPADEDGRYAWSAAFVSYVMRIAGAGPRFPYSPTHSDYIDIAREMSLGQTSGWVITAERPGRLCAAPGRPDLPGPRPVGRLRYDDLPAGRFPAHCDIVVQARTGPALRDRRQRGRRGDDEARSDHAGRQAGRAGRHGGRHALSLDGGAARAVRDAGELTRPATQREIGMDKPLAGKVALVTGSGKNIGRAIALRLARDGASVVVNGRRDRAVVDAVVGEINALGGQAIGCIADVTDPAAVGRMIEQAVAAMGGLDILVSNAGLRRQTAFLDMSLEEWREILSVALDGAFILARAAVPHMIPRGGGAIVALSGISTHVGTPNRCHVSASKAGLEGLMRALAIELAPHRITCNCVVPRRGGHGARRFGRRAAGHAREARRSRSSARRPRKKSPRWCGCWSGRRAATSPARPSTSTAGCS